MNKAQQREKENRKIYCGYLHMNESCLRQVLCLHPFGVQETLGECCLPGKSQDQCELEH